MRTLAIALVAVGCADGEETPSPRDTAPPAPTWDPTWADLEAQALILVNEERARGGPCDGIDQPPAPELVLDPVLRDVARAHSEDMAEAVYFGHLDPEGRNPSDRMHEAGFSGDGPWGENIAAGYNSAESVVAGWIASPHHCVSLRDGAFGASGIGLYYRGDDPQRRGWFWTQVFAGTPGAAPE